MNFKEYLIEQIYLHPSVQPQDIVKLCYQAAYGAEHLLGDINIARKYFEREYSEIEPKNIALYETISEDICRINLAAWKYKNLPREWLFKMFISSVSVQKDGDELFLNYLETAEKVLMHNQISFSFTNWNMYLEDYRKNNMSAVHHSSIYRECENPSYRIVNRRYIRLLPILEQVAKREQKNRICIIAIDGRAASGKSTMAKQLEVLLEADIVHMDDFFLPTQLRTEERLNSPGGNVHYERFIEEVQPYLSLPQSFSYRKFDCSKMDFNGKRIISNTHFRIVEGSYSCHPSFGDYADVTVFSDVNPNEQLCRIRRRNGCDMEEMFKDRWIPLEEKYFEAYKIFDKADIRLDYK